MKKSLIVIASALLLTVAASSAGRLRYDSNVFADTGAPTGGYRPQATQVEYPPCVPGVREDRCIQLYERGVRRGYHRWLAAHGRGDARQAAARDLPRCRSRRDGECRQANGTVRRRAGAIQQAQRFRTTPPAVPMLHRASAPRPRTGPVSTPGI